MKWKIDDRPPAIDLCLLALQWLMVIVPSIVIVARIVGLYYGVDGGGYILYLQKMSFVMAVVLLFQTTAGHRLPLISGPATALLVGILSSGPSSAGAVNLSIFIGGALLCLLAATGFFTAVRRLFTARIVASVLLLIVFTLLPAVLKLIAPSSGHFSMPFFALLLVISMLILQVLLRGVWKSTVIVWSMIGGSLIHRMIFNAVPFVSGSGSPPFFQSFFAYIPLSFTFDPAVTLSFFFCFVALIVNDLASVESLQELLDPPKMKERLTRGLATTGGGNMLAGFFGIAGPVNYSISPGIIVSTGSASRFPVIGAGIVLAVLAFSPALLSVVGAVPPAVVGAVLIYILGFQVSAGFTILAKEPAGLTPETGLVVGLPLIFGSIVSFFPSHVIDAIPALVRPVAGNGFVVGVVSALLLEHLLFRKT